MNSLKLVTMMASIGSPLVTAGWTMCDVAFMICGCMRCNYILAEGDMQLSYILVYDILFGLVFAGMICASGHKHFWQL